MFLTPKRNFHLDEKRKRYDFDALEGKIQPRVIVFRAPPGKTSFLSVRILDEGREHMVGGILWDIFSTMDLPAEGG